MAVRFLEANLAKFEKGAWKKNQAQEITWFITIIDEYQVLSAIPAPQKNEYESRINEYRK